MLYRFICPHVLKEVVVRDRLSDVVDEVAEELLLEMGRVFFYPLFVPFELDFGCEEVNHEIGVDLNPIVECVEGKGGVVYICCVGCKSGRVVDDDREGTSLLCMWIEVRNGDEREGSVSVVIVLHDDVIGLYGLF